MALVHHLIVWTAAGGRSKAEGKYHILGDDIVIFDVEIYSEYKLLLDSLGCKFTCNTSATGFEFAKRVFVHGFEVTGAYTQAL